MCMLRKHLVTGGWINVGVATSSARLAMQILYVITGLSCRPVLNSEHRK